jgi:hypothetical protein
MQPGDELAAGFAAVVWRWCGVTLGTLLVIGGVLSGAATGTFTDWLVGFFGLWLVLHNGRKLLNRIAHLR